MRKIFEFFIVAMYTTLFSLCSAVSLHDYPNVAVLPYANKAAVSSELTMGDATVVSEFVIEQLVDSNRFNMIEREEIEAIVKEHQFNMDSSSTWKTRRCSIFNKRQCCWLEY